MLLKPLLLLAVYTFIFTVVFRARWPQIVGDDTMAYALVIFSGLITFSIFSDTVSAAPNLILSHRNLVKRSSFPLEILPIVTLAGALFQAALSFVVLILALLLTGHALSLGIFLIALVWLSTGLFSLGIAYLLSAGGVFLRDLDQVVGLVVTALFFGSAIFYPLSQLPEKGRQFLAWNPTAIFVEDTRRVVFYGETVVRAESGVLVGLSLAVFWFGYTRFMRSKGAFADVF